MQTGESIVDNANICPGCKRTCPSANALRKHVERNQTKDGFRCQIKKNIKSQNAAQKSAKIELLQRLQQHNNTVDILDITLGVETKKVKETWDLKLEIERLKWRLDLKERDFGYSHIGSVFLQ